MVGDAAVGILTGIHHTDMAIMAMVMVRARCMATYLAAGVRSELLTVAYVDEALIEDAAITFQPPLLIRELIQLSP